MRKTLNDTDTNVYVESLKLLEFGLTQLIKYLTTLDIHIIISTFISIITQRTTSTNIKIQMHSDKFILYLSNVQSIGPMVVVREVFKSISNIIIHEENQQINQRKSYGINFFASQQPPPMPQQNTLNFLPIVRFLGILQLLIQQFKNALCYQREFLNNFTKMAALLWNVFPNKANLKQIIVQVIFLLFFIYENLDG